MKRRFLTIICLGSALMASAASAAVVSHDWKTLGDELLTYDTVNKREWLDLSQTILDSRFPGTTREDKYQYVVGQTATGSSFEGFRPATIADVTGLAESAGIDVSTITYNINAPATMSLIQLLAITGQFPTGQEASGLVDEVNAMSVRKRADFGVYPNSQAGLSITYEIDRLLSPPPGVFLFRAIPEPTAIAHVLLGLAFIFSRVAHHR